MLSFFINSNYLITMCTLNNFYVIYPPLLILRLTNCLMNMYYTSILCPPSTGVATYEDTPCPSGHYCPPGTAVAMDNPCPAGTYYNSTMARMLEDCLPCPGGEYCETRGLAYPTGKCSQGTVRVKWIIYWSDATHFLHCSVDDVRELVILCTYRDCLIL